MLRPQRIALFDWPLAAVDVRVYLPFIETLASDDEAWHAGFTDEDRLFLYKAVFGNCKEKRRQTLPASCSVIWPAAKQLSLSEVEG